MNNILANNSGSWGCKKVLRALISPTTLKEKDGQLKREIDILQTILEIEE